MRGEEERKMIALRGEEDRKTMSAITPPSDPSALAGLLGDASPTEPAGHQLESDAGLAAPGGQRGTGGF
jgi:hypothetical protein